MSDTNATNLKSSQKIVSSQTLESDDEWKPSTQDIVNVHTQEASNASDFFDNLRDSQVNDIIGNESPNSHSNENQIKLNELTDISVDSFNGCQHSAEKKKRGRKRKIRTAEELEVHLKEKKEKNRLAAQRLRQKKGTEIAKYDQEVVQLEANVRAKRQFAELIESNVNQLRNKIKLMFGQKVKTPLNIKIESLKDNDSTKSDNLNDIIVQQTDQNANQNQLRKLQL